MSRDHNTRKRINPPAYVNDDDDVFQPQLAQFPNIPKTKWNSRTHYYIRCVHIVRERKRPAAFLSPNPYVIPYIYYSARRPFDKNLISRD